MELFDTIAAISTPPGEGGIGIVRISGNSSKKIAANLFQPKNNKENAAKYNRYWFSC